MKGQNFSITPKLNKAKSYFTGSDLSNLRSAPVSSTAASQSTCFLFNNPSFLTTLATCTSIGQISCEGEIFFHKPKSTPLLSSLTIHLKNIFNRLQVDLCKGDEMCFSVLLKCSNEKKYFLKWIRLCSAFEFCAGRNAGSSELCFE